MRTLGLYIALAGGIVNVLEPHDYIQAASWVLMALLIVFYYRVD